MKFGGAIGGPSTAVAKAVLSWNEEDKIRADADICGHFHQYIRQGRFLVSPSIVGTSAYGIRSKCTNSVVAQSFLHLTNKRIIEQVEILYAE
jgi:hypothetical protein